MYRFALIALVSAATFGCDSEVTIDESSGDSVGTGVSVVAPADSSKTPSVSLPRDSALAGAAPSGPVERPNVTAAVQQRIDKWLTFFADSLNDYGDAKGTMYAGGTPLFSEVSGKPVSKYEYIVVKHPERPWDQAFPEGWKKSPEPKKKPKVTTLPEEDEEQPRPRPRRKKPAPKPTPPAPEDELTPP